MVRVVVGGDELDDFAAGAWTDHYVKLQLPPPGADYAAPFDPEEVKARLPRALWPRTRTYSVRAWDGESRLLTIDFVVHGDDGVAGPWAATAAPGDVLQLSGPGGAYAPDPDAAWHLMVGDLSVLPAIGASLERVPAGVPVHVVVELDDDADRQPLTSRRRPARHLAAGRRQRPRPGRRAARARVSRRPVHAFVHGEASSVRAVRRHLLVERGVAPEALLGLRLLEADAYRGGLARGQGGVEAPRRAGRWLTPEQGPFRAAPMLARVAKQEHPQASIDWASAEVEGGDLTVALTGEPNAEWAKRVQAIVERLERSGSAWGTVKVTKTARRRSRRSPPARRRTCATSSTAPSSRPTPTSHPRTRATTATSAPRPTAR